MNVTFPFSSGEYDYTIEAVVERGLKSVRSSFDRFQEPDDEDEATIISITDQDDWEYGESDFSSKDIAEMKALAIEAAAEESVDETE